MIICRAQEQEVAVASCLQEMNAVFHRLQRSDFTDHASAVELLIDFGEFEAAVVAATLAERGCPTDSYTVRCQGHSFDRRLALDPVLEDRFRADAQPYFLIVDEGPGLSGSSLCSVAQKLADLGVPDERIIFFPSRDIDGTAPASRR